MNIKPFAIAAALIALLLAGSSADVRAAEAKPPSSTAPAFPTNSPGRVASALLASLNSTATSSIDDFVAEHLASELTGKRTQEDYRKMLSKLRQQGGGFDVVRFNNDARSIRILALSRVGQRELGIEILGVATNAARATAIDLHPMPPKPPQTLPAEPLDRAGQLKAIEEYITASARAGLFSGSVLVAKDGDVLLRRAWGYAHEGKRIANKPETRFGTASVGKMFTAVAIAQLVESGQLSYDDTIGKFFPDFPDTNAARRVTIHHLLTHTAGIGDPFESPKYASRDTFATQKEWFASFAGGPLAFEPGARHEYSNGGYLVLACIVEKLTGETFVHYAQKHIFKPAHMTATGATTISEPPDSELIAVPHQRKMISDPLGIEARRPKYEVGKLHDGAGMGGWTSNVDDLFRFARAFRAGQFVSRETTALLAQGKVPISRHMPNVKYGYGFYEITVKNDRMVGHSGGGGDMAVAAEVEMLWDAGFTVVVLSNYDLPETRRMTHDIVRFLAKQNGGGPKN